MEDAPMSTQNRWKPSVFNNTLQAEDRSTWFNSRTSCLFSLDKAMSQVLELVLAEIAEGGHCPSDAVRDSLSALGLIVPENLDEYESERLAFQERLRSRDTLKVTIAPTMACNLRCTYCFQQNLQKAHTLDAAIQSGIVELLRRMVPGIRLLIVQWFGGEPLLAWRQIREMTAEFRQICRNYRADYYAELLTNGTLLTTDKIEDLERIAVRALQLPLDGNVATYAERKQVRLDKALRFHQFIAQNLQSIVDKTGSVTIRVNIDRDNPDGGKEVVRMIRSGGCIDPRIDFRLGFLNTSRGVLECIPHDCLSPMEFSDVENEFRRFLAEQGYRVYGSPERRKYPCAAPVANSFTVDPRGRIGKCVPSIGTEESSFAQIYPGDPDRTLAEMRNTVVPYANFDPFAPGHCHGRTLLPACLGSCPKMHEPGASLQCSMKPGLRERLAFYAVTSA
jgi:uncharacterized protein